MSIKVRGHSRIIISLVTDLRTKLSYLAAQKAKQSDLSSGGVYRTCFNIVASISPWSTNSEPLQKGQALMAYEVGTILYGARECEPWKSNEDYP